jgi:hypothetical protein
VRVLALLPFLERLVDIVGEVERVRVAQLVISSVQLNGIGSGMVFLAVSD